MDDPTSPIPREGGDRHADEHATVPIGDVAPARRRALPTEDLTQDPALQHCCRMDFEGHQMPSIGRIPLLRKIGHGGMGVVYYGVNPRLETEVAVKVLPQSAAARDGQMVDRFLREARLAARIRSEHLVSVLDVDRDPDSGINYLVMEFVRGRSAGDHLRKSVVSTGHALDERSALDICIAATSGLAAAHLEGVVHRDVKPDNILIPVDGNGIPQFTRAKLADLGLARADDGDSGLTQAQLTLGTPGYMAPEQAKDARRAKKPADVFSMGATLYALLCGNAPFAAGTAMAAVLRTIEGRFRPLPEVRPDVSPGTAAIVTRCLQSVPSARFADATSLLAAMRHAREAVPAEGSSRIDVSADIDRFARQSERGKRVATDPGPATAPEQTEPETADLSPEVGPAAERAPDGRHAQPPRTHAATGLDAGLQPSDETAVQRALKAISPAIERPPARSRSTVTVWLALALAAAAGLGIWWSGSPRSPAPEVPGREQQRPAPPPPEPPREPVAPAANAPEIARQPRRIAFNPGDGWSVRLGDRSMAPGDTVPDGRVVLSLLRPDHATQSFEISEDARGEVTVRPPRPWEDCCARVILTEVAREAGVTASVNGVEVELRELRFPSARRCVIAFSRTDGFELAPYDVWIDLGKEWHPQLPLPWKDGRGTVRLQPQDPHTYFVVVAGGETRVDDGDRLPPSTYAVRVQRRDHEDGRGTLTVRAGEPCTPSIEVPPHVRPLTRAEGLARLANLGAWDTLPDSDQERAARAVVGSLSSFEWLRMETFQLAGVRHRLAVVRHTRTELEFVLVPGTERGAQPYTDARLDPFLVARLEVDQRTWRRVMSSDAPASKFRGDELPKDSVSWNDVVDFCERTGLTLPTECQWEHACRGGSTKRWATGDDETELSKVAVYDLDFVSGSTAAVGGRLPNAFGLFDMHGNVREWCLDSFEDSPAGTPEDGTGRRRSQSGEDRCIRGGSFYMPAASVESARGSRGHAPQASRMKDCGFRPVHTLR